MSRTVGVSLQTPVTSEYISQAEGRGLVNYMCRFDRRIEIGLSENRRAQKLERVVCLKFKGARGVWNADKIFCKEIGSGFVKTPVRQSDTRIKRLKFPFQI